MNKIIFKKLSQDILNFFLISSLSISLIIWVVQSINLLDIVSEDGYSIKTYFSYTLLSLPKIFSRIMIFTYFISTFYIINKYQESNEILVFWVNGIRKIEFINYFLKLSLLFLITQILLNNFIVPVTQDKARLLLKKSNLDFLPTLISEKKFINVLKNLTIFVDSYRQSGELTKVYINEKISPEETKIIISETGKIIKKEESYILKLFNGKIINSNKKNILNLSFQETEYDLSKFSSNFVTHQKVQQIESKILINCIIKFYSLSNLDKNHSCIDRKIKSISEEMYKRLIVPIYIIIISLISACLVLKPKYSHFIKYQKLLVFFLGFSIIIVSEISFKFIKQIKLLDFSSVLFPIFLVIVYYLYLLLKSNFKIKYL